MRVALDATSSLGADLSGVGVYSREILYGLAETGFAERWEWFYRSQRYWRALRVPKPPKVTQRFLADSWGNRSADLFHGLAQRLPKRRFRCQICTFHDLFVLTGGYSSADFRTRFAAQARHAAAESDLIIAVSAFTASQLEQLLGVDKGRIRVVPHGCLPRKLPDVERENVVLCVGAIQKRKNQAALVRAFRGMPEGWRLVLAGSQGFDAAETMREAERSPRAADIQITGYLDDAALADWYARARIFAFPSLDEGFGMPLIEAMAAGVPVIAGNRSALPEVCGDAAILVDPENEDELEIAMRRLAEDQALRNELISRGKVRAAEFSWPRAVQETIAVYRELTV